MPSQQLPKSSKVDTLPDDLKAIAQRLIRDKFGFKVKHEPELMEGVDTITIPRMEEVKPIAITYIEIYSRDSPYRDTFALDLDHIDRGVAERLISERMRYMSRRYGSSFMARTLEKSKYSDRTRGSDLDYRPRDIMSW